MASLPQARHLAPIPLAALLALACGTDAAGGDSDSPADDDNLFIGTDSDGSGGTGTGGTGTVPGAGGGSATGGLPGSGGAPAMQSGPSHVVVVAHQDDDLLFINPDLKRAIDRGEDLTTIYLTSGNAGMSLDYVLEREAGIKSAYAFMTGGTNSWTCAPASYAGKSIETCEIAGAKSVRLLFLRLVDGFSDGSVPGSLKNLWQGSSASSSAVDSSGLSFTRDELVATLTDALSQHGATAVYTTDFSFENRQNDHSDHENAALFTLAASGAYSLPHTLSSYLTYGTTSMTENLSATDRAVVADTFGFYSSCDSEIDGCSGGVGCDTMTCSTTSVLYQSWFSRHYNFTRLAPPQSLTLKSDAFIGSCVNSSGASITSSSCTGATNWSWNADYSLTDASGLCLTAPALNTSRNATAAACTGASHQKWFLMDNGLVVLGSAPSATENGSYELAQCLDAGTGAGTQVVVMDCGTDPALKFSY